MDAAMVFWPKALRNVAALAAAPSLEWVKRILTTPQTLKFASLILALSTPLSLSIHQPSACSVVVLMVSFA
jgi:hypothetical protein